MFDSLKNIKPAALYFASVICLVLANVLKNNSLPLYYILLILGIGLFFVAVIKRSRPNR